MARKHGAAEVAALQAIREACAERDRRLQEFEDSIEPQRHAIRTVAEDEIVQAVARARTLEGLSKRSIMEAARTTNWDRWKNLESRSDLYLNAMSATVTGPILEEVTQVEIPRLPDAPWYAMGGKVRAFRLREWKNPNSNRKAREPHADIIVYRPEPIHVRQDWDNGPVANPSWANDAMAPLGEHADEIIEAVQRWIEEHPEVER